MPRGVASTTALPLPDDMKFEVVSGTSFIRVSEASKVSRIHPVALEMSQALLKSVGGAGAAFTLRTPEMVSRADDIRKVLTADLRKCAKRFEPNRKIKVKSHRDGDRLVFWYSA